MKKILVVEDNIQNMRLIVKLLKNSGYEVIEAKTGEDGVKLAKKENPDLILMDILLPGINGLETTKRIRAIKELTRVSIIAITSYAMVGDREKFLAGGLINGYIEKPIDPFTIIEEIEEIWKKI